MLLIHQQTFKFNLITSINLYFKTNNEDGTETTPLLRDSQDNSQASANEERTENKADVQPKNRSPQNQIEGRKSSRERVKNILKHCICCKENNNINFLMLHEIRVD